MCVNQDVLQDQLISTPSPETVFYPGIFLKVCCLIYVVYQHKTTTRNQALSPCLGSQFSRASNDHAEFLTTFMPRTDPNAAWAPLWLNEMDGDKKRSSLLFPGVEERMNWWTTRWSPFWWTVKVYFNWWQMYKNIIGNVKDRLAANERSGSWGEGIGVVSSAFAVAQYLFIC